MERDIHVEGAGQGRQRAVSDGPTVTLLTNVPQPLLSSAAATSESRAYDTQTGAFTTAAVDAPVTTVGPELTVQRTYNSLDSRTSGAFGAGWSSRYDMRLGIEPTGNALVTLQDGSQVQFGKNADGSFAPPRGQTLSLVLNSTSYLLKDATGSSYTFTTAGQLTLITPPVGQPTTLSYTGGLLSKITNGMSKRSLTFTWTSEHVTKVSRPRRGAPFTWTYTYAGNSLTSVCGPDANCIRYTTAPSSLYGAAVSLGSPDSYWRLSEPAGETAAPSEVAVNVARTQPPTQAPLWWRRRADGCEQHSGLLQQLVLERDAPQEHRETKPRARIEMWFKIGTKSVAAPLLSYQNTALGSTATTGVPVLYVGTDGSCAASSGTARSTRSRPPPS